MRGKNAVVAFAIGSPVYCVQDTVPPARLGQIKEGTAKKAFAGFAECEPYRVVHPTGDDHLQLTAVRPGSIDMSGARLEGLPIAKQVDLRSKGTFAPVEKTIWAKVWTVHIVSATLDGTAVEPNGPLIRNMVAIRVGELPNMRRGSDVDGTFINEDALRERQTLREDSGMVEGAVAIPVDQTQNPVSRVLELLGGLVRIARAIRNVERSVDVEIHVDGTLHQGRSGHLLQGIAIRQGKGMRVKLYRFYPLGGQGKTREEGIKGQAGRWAEEGKKGFHYMALKSDS